MLIFYSFKSLKQILLFILNSISSCELLAKNLTKFVINNIKAYKNIKIY